MFAPEIFLHISFQGDPECGFRYLQKRISVSNLGIIIYIAGYMQKEKRFDVTRGIQVLGENYLRVIISFFGFFRIEGGEAERIGTGKLKSSIAGQNNPRKEMGKFSFSVESNLPPQPSRGPSPLGYQQIFGDF